ncbi:MAG: MMPL family transporter, partial [Micrococcales bacterium]|nr:MMPL family transporter [Micrococcales bacterium]
MSSILDRLGHRAFRARRLVLAMWVVVLVLAGAGAAFLSDGTDDSFRLPGTQSGTALERLAETFPQFAGTSAQLIAVAPPGVTVTDAAVRGPVSAAVSAAAAVSGVAVVTDPYTSSPAGAVSRDGTAALVTIQLRGQASGTRAASGVAPATIQGLLDVATALQRALPAGATASLGGELDDVAMPAIGVTEGVGLVIAVAVLLVVFGSSVAAGLPLATALLGVGVSVGLSYAATAFVSVNSTAPMLALMLGLAVGIDYTLFIVHRHRGQLAAGMAVEESAARALATAGSAVVWAGLTVMVALAGLFVVGIPFLTTMGLAAAGAVGIAVLIAVTLTPALLGFAGERLRPCSRSGVRFGARIGVRFGDRFFRGWLTAVTRVPALTIAAVVGIVALLAWPAAGLRLGVPDAGSQPAGSPARVTYDLIADHFGPGVNGPLIVTGALTGTAGAAGVTGALATAGAATAGAAG